MTTPERSVEEIVEEFYSEFTHWPEDEGADTPWWNGHGVTPYLVEQWFIKKLQTERQKRDEVVVKIDMTIADKISLLSATIKQSAVTDKGKYIAARNVLLDLQTNIMEALTQPNNTK